MSFGEQSGALLNQKEFDALTYPVVRGSYFRPGIGSPPHLAIYVLFPIGAAIPTAVAKAIITIARTGDCIRVQGCRKQCTDHGWGNGGKLTTLRQKLASVMACSRLFLIHFKLHHD